MLYVDNDGLKLADSGTATSMAPVHPAPPAPPHAAPPAPAASYGLPNAGQMLGNISQDIFTWVFGAGAVLVILFMFFPLLDQFHAARLSAKVRMSEMKERRDEQAARDKGGTALETFRKDQEKREKDRRAMQEEAEAQQAEAQLNRWRDGWGMLLGFLLLAVSAIAWLQPNQPKARKVVAGIIICAELLLVFIVYVIQSTVAGAKF